MTETSLVYITTENPEDAKKIAGPIIQEKLAACANIIPGMNSVYEWKGQICEDSECILILKTRSALVDQLTERVRELHNYECPCIVALPIQGGYEGFLSWITEETS